MTTTLLEKFNADDDWRQARRKVLYKEVVCLFKRCSVDLLSFHDVQSGLHLHQKLDRGVQMIPLENIRGSVGRYGDFDAAFMPRKDHLRERWETVDKVVQQGKAPPIEVYQVGDVYFVVDGNHRVSVSRQRGLEFIEAHVTEFITPFKSEVEADINEMLIEAERSAFMEIVGEENAKVVDDMVFTCTGCYEEITTQVETYIQQKDFMTGTQYTFPQAFPLWYGEVYEPSVKAIRKNNLLSPFPGRTEGDLFVWSFQNNRAIEAMEGGEDETLAEQQA